MKIILKVIEDNGYKIELIRPIKDVPLRVGQTVELNLAERQSDLVQVFNNLLDEETKNLIFDKLNSAKEPVVKDEIKQGRPFKK